MTSKEQDEKPSSMVSSQSQSLLIDSTDDSLANLGAQLSNMADTVITSLSSNEIRNAGSNLMASNSSIIITSDGIVFPPGSIMMSSENNEDLVETSSVNENTTNENSEFDIKVESNPLKTNPLPNSFKMSNNQNDEGSNTTSFTINQNMLQNLADADSDLQPITFSQFQIQMPLTMNEVQQLHEINKNVFISQAALPDDNKLEGDNISMGQKHPFLTSSNSLDGSDTKAITVHDDAKQYLTQDANFSADDSSAIFIKHESTNSSQDSVPRTESMETIKSESVLATANQSNTQMNNAPSFSQIVYVQVDNGTPHQLLPVSVTTAEVQTEENDSSKDDQKSKKKARKPKTQKLANLLPKETDKSNLRALAPRLLSYPLYAGAQASIGAGKALLKPYDLSSMELVEGGQYFEVLGRCTQCFRFSRTTSYCRAEKNHREPKSSVCLECEYTGLSTVVCRRKLNHSAPNAQPLNIVINTALQNAEHVKQLCIRNSLPACFGELHSIVIHHADITFVGQRSKDESQTNMNSEMIPSIPQNRKPTDYARGYLFPYSKEKWDQWLMKFCHQTNTNYRIRTGKRVNKKTDHGLVNHNGKITSYRTLETQLYNCALGGKPRKRKLKDGTRKRKERGSKLIGCPAVIHTRLVETEYQWRALEITAPKILAHLSSHDPRTTLPSNDTFIDYNDMVVTQVNPSELQPDENGSTQDQQAYDFVQVINTEAEKKENGMNEVRKNTKNLLITCASLLDAVQSVDVLNSLHDSAQDMLNVLIKDVQRQPPAKKTKKNKEELPEIAEIEQVTSPGLEQMEINLLNNVS